MDPILIRPFRATDARALWDIFYSAIHQTAAADYSTEQLDAWAGAQLDMAQWASRMEQRNPFIAEIQGQAVGYADLQPDGCIDHFFVCPAGGRRGVGTALMRHILARASEAGIERVFSNVSITARPFFEAFGFAVIATQEAHVRGAILKNYRMEKPLALETSLWLKAVHLAKTRSVDGLAAASHNSRFESRKSKWGYFPKRGPP